VSLSTASAQQITVDFATVNGTATAGTDYTADAGTLTFGPGVTTQQITVAVTGDLVFEANETFLVNLTNAINASIADGQGQGTITNDDTAPTLAISDVTVAEGNSGATNAVFTVSLTGPTALTATVDFTTANNTAAAGSDYTSAAGTLTFAPGTTSQQITVAVTGDTVFEANESFFVNLGTVSNATVTDGQGVGTITNDDTAPTLAINDVTVAEGGAGATTNAVFTVTLTGATALPATVNFATADGAATAGSDYTAANGTLTFAPGTTSQQITVAVTGDTLNEANETFFVNLSLATNATITDAQGQGTITNDDGAPALSINDVTVTEGATAVTNAVFTVSLATPSAQQITVDFTTANNTAVAPGDYVTQAGTLTFAPGVTTQQITVGVIGDIVFEGNETFFVNLTNASNATIADNQSIGTITNDDQAPGLAINDVAVGEGNAATTNAVFTVTLTGPTELPATVNFTTANVTATAPSDYTTTSGTLTFAPGTTSQQITVPIVGDTTFEAAETFQVNLSGAGNATITDPQGIGTITNDDTAPTLSINDVTVIEGNTGTTNAVFTVTLTGATALPATVNFATANDTATAGSDYTATNGTLTFAAGTTAQQVTVAVLTDALNEPDETFFVNLSGAANATIADGQGVGTITNDDGAPTLVINDVTVAEGNTGTTNAVFTVSLTAASAQQITVGFTTTDVGAVAPGDYAVQTGTLTFAPGVTTQAITVAVVGDTVFELTETFQVNLSNPVNAAISDGQGIGTITNDDTAPTLTINDVAVTEGDAGTTNAVFTVTLNGATALPATVNFATGNGTAIAGTDYVAASGTLTFAPGTTTQPITVAVQGDLLDEAAENFFVNLSGASNATITDPQGQGTINDNDPTPTLVINDVTVAEGNAGTTNAVFTVTLSAPSGQLVTVAFATANETAIAPGDYATQSGTLTFGPGVTTQQITVAVVGDAVFESNESFVVNLSNATNAIIDDTQGTGSITNDDPAPTLAINDVTVTEGNTGTTNAVFTVTLTGATALPATVNFATADGTATAGSDYTAASGTLTFAPGTTSQLITVAVTTDLLNEPNETFFVNLTGAVNATVTDPQGLGTITNDDGQPALSINDVAVAEGNTGTTNAVFTVSLSAPSALPVTVDFATAPGTATSPADFAAQTGTLTFAAGTTTQLITVAVVGEAIFEANETFVVNLTNPTNALLGDGQGQGTITNDDLAPTLTINDVTVTEGSAGTTNAVFTVTLTGPTALTATVNFATANGTAVAPADYATATGTLTFAPGTTAQTITVAVVGDTLDEVNETFNVNLSGQVNATITDGLGVGTITDDDPAPTISINDVAVSETNGGTSAVFTVALSTASGQTVTVNFATADGTATAGSDYTASTGTLTFAPGVIAQTIIVPVTGDVVFEANETFVVNLSNPINATLSDGQGQGTINNDDPAPTLAINDVTVIEGDTGQTTNAVFTVTLTGATALPATVNFATADNTATAASGDYTATSGTLTFAPGTTSHSITVAVLGDVVNEATETFFLNLTLPTNATISDAQGQGTITDNDAAPTLSINDIGVTEGNAGTTNAVFTVSMTSASSQPVTVNFTTANGTATAGADYTAASGTLTFAPGTTTQLITVPVLGDTLFEGNETFQITLSGATVATINDGTGVGTITDDDAAPGLVINDITVTEGDAGSTNAVFTVTLTGVTAVPATVNFTTANNTATAGSDYTTTSGTLTFNPGTAAQQITVPVLGDLVGEAAETFFVNLSGATNATITDNQGVGTINDNDAAPTLSINDITVTEGDTGTVNAVFTVSLSAASGQAVTVAFATADGTAVAPADYAAQTGTLTFAAGTTTQLITVAVAGDTLDEVDETFFVNLSNAQGGGVTIADNQGAAIITDTDPEPTIRIDDVSVNEGDTGTTPMVFTLRLSAASGQTIAVNFTTGNSSAVAPGDFVAQTGTVTFAPGTTSQALTIAVNGDGDVEAAEAFSVTLSQPLNATLETTTPATGRILNDDLRTLVINDIAVVEGDTGTANAVFTVTLSEAATVPVSASFSTSNSSALAGIDFLGQVGTITFAPGSTAQTITVPIVGDTDVEGTEQFFVSLSQPVNATITNTVAGARILDNDVRALSISDAAVSEGDTGTANAVFTVSLSQAAASPVVVNFATSNSSAVAGTDYVATVGSVTFAAGTTVQTLTVPVIGDGIPESTETFFVSLTQPLNAVLDNASGIGRILDDDTRTLTIDDAVFGEGNTANPLGSQATADSLSITRNGALFFSDAFADGVAPPSAPNFANGTPASYFVRGSLAETNGRLALNESGSALTTGIGQPSAFGFDQVLLLTDINPADLTAGLKSDDTFSVTAVFDVSVPASTFEFYGLRLADYSTGISGNDILNLAVRRVSDTSVRVEFFRLDQIAGTFTSFGSFALDPSQDQISLTLAKNSAVSNDITASFFYIDGGVNGPTTTFATTAPIFNGENWTRAELHMSVPVTGFTVTLSEASAVPVTVNYTTTSSSAVAGNDFQPQTGTLSFAPGVTTQFLTVPMIGDVAPESTEQFFVNLSQPVNATVANGQGIGRILDDDVRTLSINDVAVIEGDAGTSNMVFTVRLSQATTDPVFVDFTTGNSTAQAPADFTPVTGTLTFAPGATTQTITVPIVGETTVESDEQLIVTLSQAVNATIENSQGIGRILDNDTVAAQPRMIINDVTLVEGDSGTTNAVFVVNLSGPSASTVTANFTTGGGTATAGADYTTTSGTVTFAPGSTTQTITVPVIGESAVENNETFNVTLSSAVNATLTDTIGTATIQDDDTSRTILINDITVFEADTGTTSAVFTLTMSRMAVAPVTVNFATAASTATTPGDFTGTSGTVTFAPGVTVQTITIPVIGDSAVENTENFNVNLSVATNATIGDTQGIATIFDNDDDRQIVINDISVVEGNAGTTNAVFTVTLSRPAVAPVTASFATANGTATQPGDYTVQTGTLTFAPGSTVQTITVAVVGDAAVESDEQFVVNLSSPINAALGDPQGIATIYDDDTTRNVVVDELLITEGNSGTRNAVFTVTMSQPSPAPVTMSFTTGNNSATAGSDYTATAGTLTFAPNTTVQTITVPIIGDAGIEGNEFFTLTLSATTNATLLDPSAFGTIIDDDSTRQIVIDDTTVVEGNTGTTSAVFTLTLNQAVPAPVTVTATTSNNSATQPGDYTTTTATLTFAANTTVQTFTVPVVGEAAVETDEFFLVTLSAPVNANLADTQAFATIFDDDARRQISIGDIDVVEGHTGTTPAVFTLTLSEPVAAPVTVTFTTVANSATTPADFVAATGTVTFAAGTTTQTFTVSVVGEGTPESNEFFFVNLSAPVNASLADTSASAQIIDDDTARQISINDPVVLEGNAGTTNAIFTLTLSQPVPLPVTVAFATQANSATTPSDFTTTTGTATFAANTTTALITVPVIGDVTVEPTELFFVNLTNPVNATIADASGQATIVDDDGTRQLSINDVAVVEGDSGTTNAVFTVSLSAPTTQTVTTAFTTANGTATAPGDYTTTAGTLTFAPGVTTQQITVPVVGDVVGEPTQTFTVNLSSPTNATLSDSVGIATIQDNDIQLVTALTIDDVTVIEGSGVTTNAVFTVSLGAPSSQTVTVNYTTNPFSAVTPDDFATQTGTLTFAPGTTSQAITVPVVGDSAVESTEIFTVTLSTPVNATIDNNQGIGRILDDDTRTLSIQDLTVVEGDSGTSNAVFTVLLSAAAPAPVTVGYELFNSSATAPGDYQAQLGTLTFAPGVTTQQITVAIVGDEIPEGTEQFSVFLSTPVNATIDNTSAIGRILDNDKRTLSILDATVIEGDSGTSSAVFTVTLSRAAVGPVTVNFDTSNSSALEGADYTGVTGTVTFAPGATVQTVVVPIIGDEIPESTEQFFVSLSAPVGASLDNSFAIGRILDNDVRRLLIQDGVAVEGDTGTTNMLFTVTLSQPALGNVTVNFDTSNSSAVENVDFTAVTGTLTFTPGSTVQTITVPVIGDLAIESTEQFFVNLSQPTDATIDDSFATGRILDNDERSIAIHDTTVIEGDSGTTNAVFTVTLSRPAVGNVVASYTTGNSTATAGNDYITTTGTVTFAPGSTSQTITVQVVGDETSENTEQFIVTLSAPINATIDNSQGLGRILDNDTRTISIQDTTVIETDTGSTSNAVFTVGLSQAAVGPVTVNFATVNGTATAANDYTATTGTLTFAPGTTTQTVTVPILGDATAETDETFTVSLTAPVNATLDNTSAQGRIFDNDTAGVRIAIDDRSIVEGDAGTQNLVFTVSLSAPSATPVTVQFLSTPSGAVAPSDYTSVAGTLSFAPNVTVQTITVPVIGDAAVESDETFTVNLSSPVNATVADSAAIGTIYDDDSTRDLFINDALIVEADSGTTNLVFTVVMSDTSPAPVTVQFATANSSAVTPNDYLTTSGVITFAPGSTTQTLTVPIVGDQVGEGSKALIVNLTNPTNAGLGDSSASGTIYDNDDAKILVINDASVIEGNTGTSNLVFTVTLSQAAVQPVTVDYATSNSSADAPSDYATTSGILTFAPGVTSQTITIAVVGDQLSESDESLTVNLSNPTNAVLGDTQGSGTIHNDDDVRQIFISDTSTIEGDTGTRNLVFTLVMSQAAPQQVTVAFSTVNSSAESPSDYTAAANGVVTFAPGSTVQTLTVPVIGDGAVESDETFIVNLSNAVNAVIGDTQAVGTIYDDDAGRTLSITNANVVEGDTGTRNLVFTVTLSQTAPVPVTVQFQTTNSSADAPSDYGAVSGIVTFAPGSTTQTITVPVVADSAVEGDESFFVTLTNAVNAGIADATATGTIFNDDSTRLIVIDDANIVEGDAGTKNLVFKLTLSSAATAPVTVQFQTGNSSAVSPGDYTARTGTVTFAPGATTATITIAIVADQVNESAESFFITLTNPVNGLINDSSATGTIFDDDNR
jgi:Calx-beta domain-containing protein